MKAPLSSLVVSLTCLAIATTSSGDEPGLEVSGGVTIVGLSTDDTRVESDQTLSADLFLGRSNTSGQWFLYLEGNSSLDARGVSGSFAEANADAGTAIDPDGSGRIQVSEFNYTFRHGDSSRTTVGLVDATAYLDRTRITNDENVQFLGTSFINNPTIEFPDYTLGAIFERPGSATQPMVCFACVGDL